MPELVLNLSISDWCIFAFAVSMFGASKTGIFGVNMLGIAIFVMLFGGKDSTGILLPILCVADITAVLIFSREAQWEHINSLLPWTIVGILIAVWIGESVNEGLFRIMMSIIILVSVGVVVANEWLAKKSIPKTTALVVGVGLVAGFTTMIGNAAGAALTLYLLAMGISKAQFIGTLAWYFLIVNLAKIPFHILVWETITFETLTLDLLVLPFVFIGSWLGYKIAQRLSEEVYRKVMIGLTALAAIAIVI